LEWRTAICFRGRREQVLGRFTLSPFVFKVPKEFPQHFLFTNLACLKSPTLGRSELGLSCPKIEEDQSVLTEIDYDYKSFILHWGKELPKILHFEIDVDEEEERYVVVPKCIRGSGQPWYDNYVKRVGVWGFRDEVINQTYSGAVAVSYEIPVDSDYHVGPVASVKERRYSQHRIHLVRDGDLWNGHVDSWRSGQRQRKGLSLPFCK